MNIKTPVWQSMAWLGIAWYGTLCGKTRSYGTLWHGMIKHGMAPYKTGSGTLWYGMVYGMIWYMYITAIVKYTLVKQHGTTYWYDDVAEYGRHNTGMGWYNTSRYMVVTAWGGIRRYTIGTKQMIYMGKERTARAARHGMNQQSFFWSSKTSIRKKPENEPTSQNSAKKAYAKESPSAFVRVTFS